MWMMQVGCVWLLRSSPLSTVLVKHKGVTVILKTTSWRCVNEFEYRNEESWQERSEAHEYSSAKETDASKVEVTSSCTRSEQYYFCDRITQGLSANVYKYIITYWRLLDQLTKICQNVVFIFQFISEFSESTWPNDQGVWLLIAVWQCVESLKKVLYFMLLQ